MVAIPQYRAKKIDSDEYVEGYYSYLKPQCLHNISDGNYGYDEIDPSTLAIHFPKMIDSEGTKIFASLSEDGNGGDIVDGFEFTAHHDKGIVIHNGMEIIIAGKHMSDCPLNMCKVTGIKK